ncbi:MAG: nuclear transport factor 2 family protein [Anaerolineales bacterium]|nr:nuclear transport factor 2 family protein [Anaerolineales bacterium]MCA9927688.1 nuclear transport factor 2 family protein [Anaerolineales bacterium]
MNQHQQLIESFYAAFQQRDYANMIACYHDEVRFSDPVFTDLRGLQAKAMWHMLCERGQDLQVTFRDVTAAEQMGQAHWEATYTFSTGRKVHNVVDASFVFRNGLIVEHRDSFDLWRWTRMALGPTGMLLGWSPFVQNKVRQTAVSSLQKFISQNAAYQS